MDTKNNLKELSAIGLSDIIGTGITALFWFYLASLIKPEQYGEIFFYLGIASIVSSAVLFAGQNTITVYIAKKIRVQTTLYFISLSAICWFISSDYLVLSIRCWFCCSCLCYQHLSYRRNTRKKTFYNIFKICTTSKIFFCNGWGWFILSIWNRWNTLCDSTIIFCIYNNYI